MTTRDEKIKAAIAELNDARTLTLLGGYIKAQTVFCDKIRELMQEPLEPVSEWLPIESSLPEVKVTDASKCILAGREVPPLTSSEWVLVALRNGKIGLDHLTGLEGLGVWWDNYRNHVTHWMPLPQPPKATK